MGGAIAACTRCFAVASTEGQWARALHLLDEMQERGFAPEQLTYREVFRGLQKACQADVALGLLDSLYEEGKSLTTVDNDFRSFVLQVLQDGGRWERALSLINEFNEAEIELTQWDYEKVFQACEVGRQ